MSKLPKFWTYILVFACSLQLVAFSHVAAQSRPQLPTIGTAGGGTMSIEHEQVLGRHYMRQIRAAAPIADDPVLREYLTNLGYSLVRHTENVRHPFHFFWVHDDSINAFAFLGGHVGMHTGLLLEAKDESELASVLSHEIAHVTQRHIARNMERMAEAGSVTVAQALGSIVLGMLNPQMGMAALTSTIAGTQQRQINYTRQFEYEADRIGMRALYDAGFDPEGAPRFFSRLAARYRHSTNPPQFLITHPLPEARVADTRSRASRLGPRDLEPSLEFEQAQARVRVRYSSKRPQDVLTEMERDLRSASHPHRVAGLEYGKALALYELERYEEALDIIMAGREEDRFNLFYLDTQTDLYIAMGRKAEIVDLLTEEYQRRPNNQVITLNLGWAATEDAQYDFAERILKDFALHHKDDLLAQELLLDLYMRSGHTVARHETQAEIFALRGNFRMAIEEMHTAHSKMDRDNLLRRQRAQARIDQFRRLEQERERVLR